MKDLGEGAGCKQEGIDKGEGVSEVCEVTHNEVVKKIIEIGQTSFTYKTSLLEALVQSYKDFGHSMEHYLRAAYNPDLFNLGAGEVMGWNQAMQVAFLTHHTEMIANKYPDLNGKDAVQKWSKDQHDEIQRRVKKYGHFSFEIPK